MITKIYIADTLIDLFADENIELVSSVLDIADISKNTTEYSKSFTVPASKTNNTLFKNYYNANIDNTFDARVKVAGRIELDGIPFKIGKFRLQKVEVKKGEPYAYTINFFGNITDISKSVNKNKLSDLNLSAYDHTYNSANIKQGLTTFLSAGSIVYVPLAKKQYYYNADSSDNTQTEVLANIAFGGGADAGIVWDDLRPSIKLINVIEAIETDYNLTFSRDFFGTSEFQNLYMWCNSDAEKDLGAYTKRIDWNSGSSFWMNHTTDEGLYVTTFPNGGTQISYTFEIEITPDPGYEGIDWEVILFLDGEERNYINSNNNIIFFTTPEGQIDVQNNIHFEITTNEPFNYKATLIQKKRDSFFGAPLQTESTSALTNEITGNVSISENMPELEIMEFLKGLFSMYKLVVIPEDDGSYYVDTINNYYSQGNVYDVTKYIDFAKYDVERGSLLNEITFKFQEGETITNIQFDKNNKRFYGDEELKITDDGTPTGELLDGESLEIELPFEQVLYERLIDQNDNSKTNVQYGAILDESAEPVNPKAHIFYNVNTSVGFKGVGFQDNNGVKTLIGDRINIPSHVYPLELNSYATIFKDEFSTWDGVRITNNLFSNHWQKYIENIFNVKKREFTFDSILPLNILYKLKLNDVLKIKENYYRIDKFNTNLLTGKTSFNLVNSFDDSLNEITVGRGVILTNSEAKTISENVTNLKNSTYQKIDTGDGVDWVTITDNNNTISFDFVTETTGAGKEMTVRITSSVTGKTKDIILAQQPNKVSFDLNTITFDNNAITWDNKQ